MSPYELVNSEKTAFPVGALCEAVGVSRSAYYAWCKATPSARELANERILAEIRSIHVESEARYGSPRVVDELRERGHEVGKHRVARLMRENGIWARVRRRFRHTTDSTHKLPVASNLLEQNFSANAPNRAWVGDITYIWTAEGWSYLAVLIDLYEIPRISRTPVEESILGERSWKRRPNQSARNTQRRSSLRPFGCSKDEANEPLLT